jgi:hypothetical protein
MKKSTARREGADQGDPLSQRMVFCTECDATLENFCFSSSANDIEAIRKTLSQCKKQGRFTGDLCSKLFIAYPEALSDIESLPDPPY